MGDGTPEDILRLPSFHFFFFKRACDSCCGQPVPGASSWAPPHTLGFPLEFLNSLTQVPYTVMNTTPKPSHPPHTELHLTRRHAPPSRSQRGCPVTPSAAPSCPGEDRVNCPELPSFLLKIFKKGFSLWGWGGVGVGLGEGFFFFFLNTKLKA